MSKDMLPSGRFVCVLILFLLWTVFIGAKTVRTAVVDRDHFIELGEKTAGYFGSLPALRGRILDSRGVALAWSERYFDLCISSSSAEFMPEPEELEPLKQLLPRLQYSPPDRIICRNLTPDEVLMLEGVIRDSRFPILIRLREERIVVNIPEIRQLVGETRLENGVLKGISGWEKEYDHTLAAVPGRFRVLRDRWMNWIPASWELLASPRAGGDVALSRPVTELRGWERRKGGQR